MDGWTDRLTDKRIEFLASSNAFDERDLFGSTTLTITTFSIMTFSIITFSMKAFSIMTFRIMAE